MMEKYSLTEWAKNNNPTLIEEWDYEKNINLQPDAVTPGSNVKAWWICHTCGGCYQATINHRTSGTGCPYCSGRKVLAGFNDLKTLYPNIAKEWDYKKNGNLTPEMITANSKKNIWWICPSCHGTYKSYVYNRTKGTGCPYCSGQRVLKGFNDLKTRAPELCEEWDYEKNRKLTPEMVSLGSNRKVWWNCSSCHNSYESAIHSRVRGSGCPYCTNRKVRAGFNDLLTTHPDISLEWDYGKNGKLKPEMVSYGSAKKVWWICAKCHASYRASINQRSRGQGCPYCAGRRILPGINDLQSLHPELAQEWDYGKNGEIVPSSIGAGSNKKVWWTCPKCHGSYMAAVANRANGSACPYCSGQRVLPGFNDLLSQCPNLYKEWDFEKNGIISPDKVTISSGKQVWWICPNCHGSYKAAIYSRKQGSGCPYCSGQRILIGFNDLKTKAPELCKEWNYEKNESLTPEMVTTGTNKRVWWRCARCGHVWRTSVSKRVSGTGCPNCATRQTSFSEQAVYYYVKRLFPDAINRDKSNPFELDIFIPSIMTAIEYDGAYFHDKNKRGMQDDEKDLLCLDAGIQLIRIREKGLPATNHAINILRQSDSTKDLNRCISELMGILRVNNYLCPDVEAERIKIYNQYTETYKENSLAQKRPDLLEEWEKKKNGSLQPEQVTVGSDIKVWWKCSICGNVWQATIYNRVKGSGCPACAAQKASQRRKYDQQSIERVLSEISPEIEVVGKYLNITTKVRCRCKICGHEWEPLPSNLLKGSGCPKCKAKERGKAQAKTTEEFAEELKEKNGNLLVVGKYINNATKIEIRCALCGEHFFKTPSQLLQVPKCNCCKR